MALYDQIRVIPDQIRERGENRADSADSADSGVMTDDSKCISTNGQHDDGAFATDLASCYTCDISTSESKHKANMVNRGLATPTTPPPPPPPPPPLHLPGERRRWLRLEQWLLYNQSPRLRGMNTTQRPITITITTTITDSTRSTSATSLWPAAAPT